MDWPFILGVTAVLGALLAVLGFWQRRLDKAHRDKTLAQLREARDRGSHRAIAQYPQISPSLCIGCGSCVAACPEDGVLGLVDGIACVIHGSRCVGHARCELACPVGAIRVGLGDLVLRPDIPILTEELETSVPGVYIAGELGGMALIRHAVEQGARAAEAIARHLPQSPARDAADVVIVGAGPAGLSASLKAAQKKMRFVTLSLDELGGTIRKYPRRKLTLVQPVEIPLHGRMAGGEYSKEDLISFWEKIIAEHRIPIQTGHSLESVRREGGLLEVRTSGGVFRGGAVILALGRRGVPRKLGAPGEESEKVLYQLADAATYTGARILVVGGGDSAIEAATGLANQKGNTVALSYRKEAFFRLKERNEARIRDYGAQGKVRVLFSSRVERIAPEAVTLAVGEGPGAERLDLPNDYVFVLAGGDPPFPLLKKIGIAFGGEASPAGGGAGREPVEGASSGRPAGGGT